MGDAVSGAKTEGFTMAGPIGFSQLDLVPAAPPGFRSRDAYGDGPFAKLLMPPLPQLPGVYLWAQDGDVVYVGQTRGTFRARLGPNGYATISTYNTFAREPGRRNGGQQTNCRINVSPTERCVQGTS